MKIEKVPKGKVRFRDFPKGKCFKFKKDEHIYIMLNGGHYADIQIGHLYQATPKITNEWVKPLKAELKIKK